MSWSIVEVARLSGVTSRTLRHYDDVGLLTPAGVASNGYRLYDESSLLRLQQILVLRALDMGLAEIAAILDEQRDELAALRGHYERVLAERGRLDHVAATIARTIAELEATQGETGMATINRPEKLFEGFDPTEYDAEARERWPAEWEQSQRYVSTLTLTPADTERMQREMKAAMVRVAKLRAAGEPVEGEAVQAEMQLAYEGVCRFWTPNAQAFKGLGQMYVDDPRFTATYDAVSPGLAEFCRDAMAVYADTRLA